MLVYIAGIWRGREGQYLTNVSVDDSDGASLRWGDDQMSSFSPLHCNESTSVDSLESRMMILQNVRGIGAERPAKVVRNAKRKKDHAYMVSRGDLSWQSQFRLLLPLCQIVPAI
jgi:hypothetical protein